MDPTSKRPQNIVVTSAATEPSTSSQYASTISTSSYANSSTPRASTLSSVSEPPGESAKPSRPGQGGAVPYAGTSRDPYRTTTNADSRPSTASEPSSGGFSGDRQSFTRFERADSRGAYLSRPLAERSSDWPSGGSEKAARKPAVTLQPTPANPGASSTTAVLQDKSGIGSSGAQTGRVPPASAAVGEISAKYQKYVDSGTLTPEKAALWTREDRVKAEKFEQARKLAAEPVTTQPKPPTATQFPASTQGAVPRSASTDPYDRASIPVRVSLASASVDIADTTARPQPSVSDAAALLRKLSSQSFATQPPLPRSDSAASVLSEIDKILNGEGKATLTDGGYTSATTRKTGVAPPSAVPVPVTADASLGLNLKARVTPSAAARTTTPPSPPSTAPPAGLPPRRHTGERTASTSSATAPERSDAGPTRLLSAKVPAPPRTESRDSLRSDERSTSRSLSRSGSAVDLHSARSNHTEQTLISPYPRDSPSRPSDLGDRSPPRSSLQPSRLGAADIAEDLAWSTGSSNFKKSGSNASLSRTASEAKLSPTAADQTSARAAADEEHAAFMALIDAKKKEREEQRLQWEAKLAGRSPTAVTARSSALTPPPASGVTSTASEKAVTAPDLTSFQSSASRQADSTSVHSRDKSARDQANNPSSQAQLGIHPADPPAVSARMSTATSVPSAAAAPRGIMAESALVRSEERGATRPLAMEDARMAANGEAGAKWAAFFATTLNEKGESDVKQNGNTSVGASDAAGVLKEPRVDPALWAAVQNDPIPAQPCAPSSQRGGARAHREPPVVPTLNPTEEEDAAPSRPAGKERVIEIAEAPIPAKPKKFYQLRWHRSERSAGGMEVVVPATYPGPLDSDDAAPSDTISIPEEAAWEQSERHWSAMLHALEGVLAEAVGKALPRALESQRSIAQERKTLTETAARINTAIESTTRAEALANQRAVNMMARTGSGHVQRDAQINGVPQDFPNGEGIILECRAVYLTFDQFACDVVNSLEDYCKPGSNVSKLFVQSLMLPVFSGTQRYVENTLRAKQERMREIFGSNAAITTRSSDDVAWQFWLYAQQLQMPAEVSTMNDQVIRDLVAGMGPLPVQLQDILEEELRAGRVSDGLDVLKLVRLLLRLHTIALLSDPPCYLHPAPGERLPYREGHCVEVLSPGTKKYGRIKEGDVVEVVLCGLYFQDPATGAKPVQPMLVRRLA